MAEIKEVLTADEADILREWRKVKTQRFGSLLISASSNGTEYIIEHSKKRKGTIEIAEKE